MAYRTLWDGSAVKRNGSLDRACVDGNGDGVKLSWSWTDDHWFQRCRFVVACKCLRLLSLLGERSFQLQLFSPPTKHFSNFNKG